MSKEKDRVDIYAGVIDRMEPDLTGIDEPAALASIAISLKRIADELMQARIHLAMISDHLDQIRIKL